MRFCRRNWIKSSSRPRMASAYSMRTKAKTFNGTMLGNCLNGIFGTRGGKTALVANESTQSKAIAPNQRYEDPGGPS